MRGIYIALAIITSVLAFGQGAAVAQAATTRSDGFSNTVRVRAEYFLYDDDQAVAKAKIARTLDRAAASGADTIDTEVVWATIDQGDWGGRPRTYDWSYLDYLVGQAESRGLNVNLMLTTTPDWVHPEIKGIVSSAEARRWTAPKGETQLKHYGNFVSDVSNRYRGRVGHYEIWNEPNHTPFWRSGPNPGQYAALLRTAYFSVKSSDPDAQVMFGGLALNNVGFVEEYYRVVKANYPDATENGYFFDVMGVHPYVHPNQANLSPDRYTQNVVGPLDNADYDFIGTVDGNYLGFRKIKAEMDSEGDTGKTMFFSEFGYEVKDGVITDARRSLYLKRAYELAMETPYVEGMSWYAFRATRHADPSSWTLLDENLGSTRSYQAFSETFASSPRSTSSGQAVASLENSGTPEVSLVFTLNGRGEYVASSKLSGIGEDEVSFWELYRDGEMIREGDGGAPVFAIGSPAEVEGSKFMLAAYTKGGSVWHSGPQSPVIQEDPELPEPENSAPRITNMLPNGGSSTKDRTPTVRANIRDAEQTLGRSNIAVYQDGASLSGGSYDPASGAFSVNLSKLSYGWHRVKIIVNDGAGKSTTESVRFRVVRQG